MTCLASGMTCLAKRSFQKKGRFAEILHFFAIPLAVNQKSRYLCIVFFIVLDLRLTRLGYSGIPFFMLL